MKGDTAFRIEEHDVDFCVVGGGMPGVCAAIAAARRGARTILMHDRPVLGGNASSEVRVHICGADRANGIKHMRETGILEELRLHNARTNPHAAYSLWDRVLYEKTRFEPNLEVLYNCSCLDAKTDGSRVSSVTGWQLTTQTYHTVKAKIFADCSGDAVLAPLSGAEFRVGREARSEYGESIAPEEADRRTMGMTCLFQAREYDTPQPFEPPFWAHRYDSEDDLPYGAKGHGWWGMGYWWVELGGEDDSIHDTERIRDELLKITFGVWDHIKNRGDHGADNWALEWVQFLPGKRESRRYVGAHVLAQSDVESEGRFDDLVAYGGWTMDDHHPSGFGSARIGAPATIFHEAPSPYGIPYRSLYSKNVDNLMFAGRCASATHAAMSSTRVMGTGCSMGQAMGTAAAIAVGDCLDPAGVGGRIAELQRMLLRDDCYLPWIARETGPLTRDAKLSSSRGNPEPIRDGIGRQVGEDPHAWTASRGDWAAYEFEGTRPVKEVSLVLDSGMDRMIQMGRHRADRQSLSVPDVCVKAFRIEGLLEGKWNALYEIKDNCQRLVRLEIGKELEGVRFTLDETWGADESRMYGFYVD
jgi:hypothetical protein